MGKVSSDFLKEMKPAYCGDESYSRDYPWCKQDPEPIDLTSYRETEKFWDVLPYHTGDAVKFCRHFQSSIFAERDKHCVGLTKDFKTEISKIIASMPDKDTVVDEKARSVIPTESKLHSMILDSARSGGDSLSSSTIFDDPYIKKSKIIRGKLLEIASLKRAGDPAMESKISALEKDIARVCVVSNPDALVRINDDCSVVIKEHECMKGWYQNVITGIGGVFSTFVILVKTGALPKMWNAGKNQWEKARAGDPENGVSPDNFIWAGIKAIGAFFVARDPYAGTVGDGTTTDDPVDGSAGPLSDKVIEDMLDDIGETSNETSEIFTSDPSSLYNYSGSADALESYLANLIQAQNSLSSFEQAIKNVGNNYHVVSNSNFNDSSLSTINGYLKAVIDNAGGNTPNTRFATLLGEINSKQTVKTIDGLNAHHMKWIFDHMLPFIVDRFRMFRDAMAKGNAIEAKEYLAQIDQANTDLANINQYYGKSGEEIYNIVNEARKNATAINPEDASRLGTLSQSLMYTRGLSHDVNNIVGTTRNIARLFEEKKQIGDIDRLLSVVDEYDLSRLDFNIKSAAKVQSLYSRDMDVVVNISKSIPKIENIPSEMKHFIFRAVNELVLNAIKYSDRSKDKRNIDIGVIEHDDGLIDIVVSDNGVGIKNTQSVLTYGARERPDLADGTGTGLSAIFDLANKMDVTLSIESSPNKGTSIALKNIDTKGWTKNNPTGNGSGGGTNGTPSTNETPSSSETASTSGKSQTASIESSSFDGFIQESELVFSQQALPDSEDEPSGLFDPSAWRFIGGTAKPVFTVAPSVLGTPAATPGAVGR